MSRLLTEWWRGLVLGFWIVGAHLVLYIYFIIFSTLLERDWLDSLPFLKISILVLVLLLTPLVYYRVARVCGLTLIGWEVEMSQADSLDPPSEAAAES